MIKRKNIISISIASIIILIYTIRENINSSFEKDNFKYPIQISNIDEIKNNNINEILLENKINDFKKLILFYQKNNDYSTLEFDIESIGVSNIEVEYDTQLKSIDIKNFLIELYNNSNIYRFKTCKIKLKDNNIYLTDIVIQQE